VKFTKTKSVFESTPQPFQPLSGDWETDKSFFGRLVLSIESREAREEREGKRKRRKEEEKRGERSKRQQKKEFCNQ